jgi:hypothetical protein
MHPQLSLIVGQQRIADPRRAADNCFVHTATTATTATATSSHTVAVPHHAAAPVSFLRSLEPRKDQAGDCT